MKRQKGDGKSAVTVEPLFAINLLPFAFSAPWHLTGVAVVLPLLSWRRGRRGMGVRGLVRYDTSPVGPYCELLEASLTLQGPTVTTMLVTSEASRQGGRQIWGYPKQVAPLVWHDEAEGRVTFRHNRKVWRIWAFGPALPLKMRAWTAQQLDGKSVRVPCAVRGKVRLAHCGRLWGALIEDFRLDVEPPRTMS